MDAKEYLRQHNIPFDEIDVGLNPEAHDEMKRLSGQRYVPTIIVDGHVLANFDVSQLEEFLKKTGDRSVPPPRRPRASPRTRKALPANRRARFPRRH